MKKYCLLYLCAEVPVRAVEAFNHAAIIFSFSLNANRILL